MKIIELLNKIANGEEVPKRIKYINSIWEYDKETKDYFNDDLWLIYSMNSIGLTERKVEILEEEKKIPEKISLNYADDRKPEEVYEYLRCSYNQLIDYLKSKGE